MKDLTPKEFQRLAGIERDPCVSVLMHTHPTGADTKQDPIRFKNLLKQAENSLIDGGVRAADAREQLAPLWSLLSDSPFWAHQGHGLAAYSLPEKTLLYSAPFSLPEYSMAGRRCYLAPLLPIITDDAEFYILALSPKQVRLAKGSHHSWREIELSGWPDNFEDLASYIEEEPQLQFHTGAPPAGAAGSQRAAVYHGHAGADEASEKKLRLLEYCRLVDRRLRKVVGNDKGSVPLLLACDERLASIYREVSNYPRVIAETLTGNPDSIKLGDLCNQAWKIMHTQVAETRQTAISRYQQAASNNLAAKRLEVVIAAAQEGRIDTLLLAEDTQRWGRYDRETRHLDLHEQRAAHDEELLNLAMLLAYQQGADVYLFAREELPEEKPAIAILRF
ncbi:MAG: hypothetical protein JXM70_18945 [Pirellulales bacterium]|nr:hypothetical protein [Pirellulales bacterium]